MPPGRLRPARPGRADALGRAAQGPGHRRLDARARRRSRAACSSATSPSSSTRATPPSPSAGPPRSRSTRGCSPSCSAGPSCASCSTPRCWPRSRPSCSGSRPSAGPAAPRASPTCSGCSARSPPEEVQRAQRRRRRRRRGAGCARARHAGSSRSGSPASSAWAAIEDVGRLRDGLGVAVPPGTPDAFTDPVDDPLADLVSRYARTHGPFTTDDVAARLGLGTAVVRLTLQRLGAQGRVLDGEFRPGASGLEWCDAEVLRSLRRRSPGPAAQGGRAGPAGRARPVPRRLAARRRQAPRGRRRGLGHRPARRCAGARQRPRAAGAGRPGPRLRAVLPRRAHRRRRGAVGRPRLAARRRRLGLACTSPTRRR